MNVKKEVFSNKINFYLLTKKEFQLLHSLISRNFDDEGFDY